MTLAESLLEGYGYITPSSLSDIGEDPISYLQEACIEAINALYEASQQYYIGDIIGQAQIVQEGVEGEELLESVGSKIKDLWEKFKAKVKQIIDAIVAKIRKVIAWIKSKFNKKKNDTLEKKCEEVKKETDSIRIWDNCIQHHRTVYDSMDKSLPIINNTIDELQDKLQSLSDGSKEVNKLLSKSYDSMTSGKPTEPLTNLPTLVAKDGSPISAEELTNVVRSLGTTLVSGNISPVPTETVLNMVKELNKLSNNVNKTLNITDDLRQRLMSCSKTILDHGDYIVNEVHKLNEKNGHANVPDQFIQMISNQLSNILAITSQSVNSYVALLHAVVNFQIIENTVLNSVLDGRYSK